MIFKMYIEGSGYGVIADALNAQGYKTKTGRPFGKGYISSIIRNERYTGVYIFNRLSSKNVDLFDGKLVPTICEAYGDYQLSKNAGHMKTKANYEKRIKEVTKSIDNIVEMIMQSPSTMLAKKLSELEQEKEHLSESYQEACKNANIKQLDEEEIAKMFKLARNQLEVRTLKMTKVLVETFIDKVIVYNDRIEVIFNFCKDVTITQEVEDIVNFNKLEKGCDEEQHNTHVHGESALLCRRVQNSPRLHQSKSKV